MNRLPRKLLSARTGTSMVEVEELSKCSLFGEYTPDALDQVQQLDSDGIDKEIQSRAPNLFELR